MKLWTCFVIDKIKDKLVNSASAASSTVEDIILHFIHLEFLSESSIWLICVM